MIKGLHHNAYRCRDSEETRRFYEDFLGLPLAHTLKIEQTMTGRKTGAGVRLLRAAEARARDLGAPGLLVSAPFGGRLFEVRKLKQLPDIAAKISGWLRNQYVLGYASENRQRDGQYRRVQVKLTRPKGFPRLHAFWRLGYYAPAE